MLKFLRTGAILAAAFGFSQVAQAQTCALPADANAQIARVVAQTNAQRQAKGIPPLRVSATLMKAAQTYACAMVSTDHFDHRGRDGSLPKARIKRAGCRSRLTAENIAMGYSSGDKIMGMWMNSSGHKRNILLRGVDTIGIGVAAAKPGQKGGPRWVQVFARGC